MATNTNTDAAASAIVPEASVALGTYERALEAAGHPATGMEEIAQHRVGVFRVYVPRRRPGPIGPPGSEPRGVIVGPSGVLSRTSGDWLAFVTAGDAAAVVGALLMVERHVVLLTGPASLTSGALSSREIERRYVAPPARETLADGTVRLSYWAGSPPSFGPVRTVIDVPAAGPPRFQQQHAQDLATPAEMVAQRLAQLSSTDTWTRYYALEALAQHPDPATLPRLRAMLTATSWLNERRVLVGALRALADRAIVPDLAAALARETDAGLAVTMVDLLGTMRPESQSALTQCARTHTNDTVRQRCAWTLTQ